MVGEKGGDREGKGGRVGGVAGGRGKGGRQVCMQAVMEGGERKGEKE